MDPGRILNDLINQDIARLIAAREALPVVTEALLTCPACDAFQRATMPLDVCTIVFDCQHCGARLRPLDGDCCVFCSYADVVCPPKQHDQADW